MLLVSPQHNKQDLMQQSLLASLVPMDSFSVLADLADLAALVALAALAALVVLEPKVSFSMVPTSVSPDSLELVNSFLIKMVEFSLTSVMDLVLPSSLVHSVD